MTEALGSPTLPVVELSPRDRATALFAVIAIGAVLRLQQAVTADFPLGDGGLFLATIEQIRNAGGLPETIAYSGQIPFVYPPLGLILGALVSAVPGSGSETVLRLLPPVFAIAALVLVPWCASRVLQNPLAGLIAGAIAAVMPQAYDPIVAGGGITRGLAVVLALSAVGAAAGSHTSARRGAVVGVLLGLTALSHPQVAMFALVSVAFVWWWRRTSLSRGEVVAAIAMAAACLVPWLAMIAARGQLDALAAGGQRFDLVVGAASVLLYPGMQVMHGGVPNLGVCLALLGVMVCLFVRRWNILLWLLALHVFSCPSFVSAVAWAIAGASGIAAMLSIVVRRPAALRGAAIPLTLVVLVAVLSASSSPSDPGSKQQSLLPEQVAAGRALSELPNGALLAVVTSETWGNDLFGEWLPALSGHTVVTTPQGSEWLGVATFSERVAAHRAGEHCSQRTSACLAAALTRGELQATHVVIPRGSVGGPRAPDECCPAILESIRDDPRFEIVIDTRGVLVAAWGG